MAFTIFWSRHRRELVMSWTGDHQGRPGAVNSEIRDDVIRAYEPCTTVTGWRHTHIYFTSARSAFCSQVYNKLLVRDRVETFTYNSHTLTQTDAYITHVEGETLGFKTRRALITTRSHWHQVLEKLAHRLPPSLPPTYTAPITYPCIMSAASKAWFGEMVFRGRML